MARDKGKDSRSTVREGERTFVPTAAPKTKASAERQKRFKARMKRAGADPRSMVRKVPRNK